MFDLYKGLNLRGNSISSSKNLSDDSTGGLDSSKFFYAGFGKSLAKKLRKGEDFLLFSCSIISHTLYEYSNAIFYLSSLSLFFVLSGNLGVLGM